ncbi:MAG: hypothetical protein JW891_12275 [Candidatus Lokiarchaeota archaeon]|nr:hypothetical protein [Candidatus Lokiarchaeota archaeon]
MSVENLISNLPILITMFVFFALIIASYSIQKLDFVAISLLCCFVAAAITGFIYGTTFEEFIAEAIEWQAIIIIFSMSIITKVAQDSNILEFLAVKLFKISKGNPRTFFYLLCVITTLLASIISDVVVVLILAPVVIRLCHFLKIRSGTYLLGMTICINIGSIITPFSSGENIIISTQFFLNTEYFIKYFWIFSFSLLFLTIFLIERFILRKEPKIEDQQKKFVLELIDTDVVVKNRTLFYFNSIAIIITIILFAVLPWLFLVAAISALVMVLINAKYTKSKLSAMLKDIEWEIIFFFISLYVVIHCLLVAGFRDIFTLIFGGIDIASQDPFSAMITSFVMSLIILLIVSAMSGFVANTPTALIFIPIVQTLIGQGIPAVPLFFAFIIGINLGGNFLPQGAACDMMTLKIAEDNGVENLNIKRLTKVGASFAAIHIGASILYLLVLNFLTFTFGLV